MSVRREGRVKTHPIGSYSACGFNSTSVQCTFCVHIYYLFYELQLAKMLPVVLFCLAAKTNNICGMKQSDHWGGECRHKILHKLIFYCK